MASGATATLANTLTGTGSGTNSGTTTVSSIFGLASLTNNSGATLTFAAGTNNSTPITNNAGGIFNVTGKTINTANLSNSGTMTVAAELSSGTITNNSGGLLIFNGADNFDNVTNNVGGTFNVTGDSTNHAAISNSGNMNISAKLLGAGTITNNSGGQLAITNAVDIVNELINDTGGIVNVSGNNNIGAITNTGTMNFTITNPSTFDSLTSSGAIDLTNGTVNVASSFFSSTPDFTKTWDIMIGTSIIGPPEPAGTMPSNFMGTWSRKVVGNNLQIKYTTEGGANVFTASPGLNTEIAAVLQQMANDITNPGQQALINAYTSATSQEQYNYFLSSLAPNSNGLAISVAMQNSAFNKVTQRLAHVQKNTKQVFKKKISTNKNKKKTGKKAPVGKTKNKSKSNLKTSKRSAKNKSITGMSHGDLTANHQLWFSTFGNIAKQHATDFNSGYRSKALGVIFGLDTMVANDAIYGVAFSIANNNVTELFNSSYTTRMLAFNAMAYGSKNLPRKMFTEWFVTGGTSKNQSRRVFAINGIDLSTKGSYRTKIFGGRINLGKEFVGANDLQISQVNSLQYALIHQPPYSEDYSTAALNISSRTNSSVLTLGTGLRFARATANPWLNGNNDLHAMVTYDALSPKQNVTANFVVGSNDFTVTSSPSRLALRVGADVGWVIYKQNYSYS